MPTRRIDQRYVSPFGHTYPKLIVDETWNRSPRVNGKLILQSNPFTRYYYFNRKYVAVTRQGSSLMTAVEWPGLSDSEISNLLSQSYARFRGKLYKGSAALGVTLSSYKESREMIVKKYQVLTAEADKFNWLLTKRRVTARDIASFHLEVVFGWIPVLSDIHAACTSVVQGADHFDKISASCTSTNKLLFWRRVGDANVLYNGTKRYRVTRSAIVRVVNMNRWLAERAGLLNPAAVAWDRVPWSFVVNMFVNTGQLVNSITDFAGLDFKNGSLTKSVWEDCTENFVAYANNGGWWKKDDPWGYRVLTRNFKVQSLNATERPPLTFRIPDANWSLAAIAASLFTQKFALLNRVTPSFSKKKL